MVQLKALPPELLHIIFDELMISYVRNIDLSLFDAGDVCRTFRDVAISTYFTGDSFYVSKSREELWERMGHVKRFQIRIGETARREGYKKRSVSGCRLMVTLEPRPASKKTLG